MAFESIDIGDEANDGSGDPIRDAFEKVNTNFETIDALPLDALTGIPQNSKSANYTLVLSDAGKCILHPSSDATARTFTIPANESVAFELGTVIKFKNMATPSCTIAITSDTMTFLPDGVTGSRTLAQYAEAYIEKISATAWTISGNSLLS